MQEARITDLNYLYTVLLLPATSRVFCFEIMMTPPNKRGAMKSLNSQYCLKDLDENWCFVGKGMLYAIWRVKYLSLYQLTSEKKIQELEMVFF